MKTPLPSPAASHRRSRPPLPAATAALLLLAAVGAATLCPAPAGAATATYKEGSTTPFTGGTYMGAEDTFLSSNSGGSQNDNFGGRGALEIGGGAGFPRNGLMRFNITSLNGQFSAINSVTLRLYVEGIEPGGNTLQVFRVAAANTGWVEGTACCADGITDTGMSTWDQRVQGSLNWASGFGTGVGAAGTDYNATMIGSAVFAGGLAAGTAVDITLTDATMISDWVAGNNAGLFLKTATDPGPRLVLRSAESSGSSFPVGNTAHTPELIIDYSVAAPEIGVQQPAGTDLVDGTASISFGSQNVPVTSAAKTFTITNTGTASLTGLAVTTDGSHPGDFTVGALGATTLAPGASTTFTVTFTPATIGARSAAIHIASNDSDENPFDIALTGTGVGTLYVPNYGPNKIEKFNSTSGAYLGSFATVTGGPINLAFDSAGNLYVTRNTIPDITKITPGGVSSVFASSGLTSPNYLAFDSAGNLLVADGGVFPDFIHTIKKITPGGVVSVFATVASRPQGLAFDAAGNLFSTIGNTIRKYSSTGTDLGLFANTGINPQGLAFDAAGNLYVAHGNSATIHKFAPNGVGSLFATTTSGPVGLTLDSAGNVYAAIVNNTVQKFSSAGTSLGVFASIGGGGLAFGPLAPEIAVQQPAGTDIADAGSKDFGSVNLGANTSLTFTITNIGDADLTLGTITKDGSHPGDFTVGALGATTLAPGASTTFTVTFTPAATGARSAAIHIASNDSDENPFDIALTGTGITPEIAVEQPAGSNIADGGSKSFGAVNFPSGGTSNLTFTIKNTGSANLTGLGITIDGTHAAMFTVTASPTAPVSGPSGSTTFTVRFAPTSVGAKTAALHIANNDLDENPFDINLTGTGIDYTVTATASMGASRGNATATLLPNGKVLVAGGSGATAEIYDPVTGTWTPTGSMNVSRSYHVAVLLPNGKVLVANGTTAELYDPATGTWTATGSMVANRPGGHTATLLANGKVLVAGGSGATAELYDPATGIWTATGSMTGNRESHTATLLANGKVLVAAGHSGGSAQATAELYDPATGLWTATGSMTGRRFVHTATRLPDGRVLVHGGYSDAPPIGNPVSGQLYDPATGTWSATAGNPSIGREYHRASLLPNGKVLISAGGGGPGANTSLEVFDPATGLFTSGGTLAAGHVGHTSTVLANGKVLIAGGNTASAELFEVTVGSFSATGSLPGTRANHDHSTILLPNGKVLVAGGHDGSAAVSGAQLYNPAAGTWTATGNNMPAARYYHTATLLLDGKVLVAGGFGAGGVAINSAALYDPVADTWSATTGSLATGRRAHTAALLPNGKVLLVGGYDATYIATAELYDPATGLFTATGSLSAGRTDHTMTLLPSGRVIVTGGDRAGTRTATGELYDPATGTWSAIASMPTVRMQHAATLLPNGKVLVASGLGLSDVMLTSSEIYDPANNSWSSIASAMSVSHFSSPAMVLLPNGKALVAGGRSTGFNDTAVSELFDPATGLWSLTAPLATARRAYGAALLPNGKVLFAGGYNNGSYLSGCELFDTGLGFSASWQPVISTSTSPLISGGSLALTGTGFRGVSGAGSGGTADSPGDHPVVQLRSLENQQVVFLHATAWSATASTSPVMGGLHAGWTLATVFVNGINSTSSIVYLDAPEMNVTGNGVTISDGDATPATADHTDFGSAAVTGGTVLRTFTIQNTHATLALNLTGTPRVSVSGTHAANFTVTSQPSTPVAAGGSTTFQVTFTPSATGLRTATLTIANDSAESPYNFAIQGTGAVVPEIGVQQPAGTDLVDGTAGIDFGNQDVSTTSAAKTFTITNSGTASLTGLVITKHASHPIDFIVGALGATTLAPNASTTFTVTFTPGAGGSRSAALQIASNDSDENPFDIALTGTGVNSPPTVASDNATVTVGEGQTAGNTGTFADANGNGTVTVTATVGTVSQNNGAGTWSWSVATTDGPDDSQTVTISANDGVNAAVTTTFTLTVSNRPPAVAADNASVSTMAGVAAANTGTFSDPAGTSDTVTISASYGSVTQAGSGGGGTWSWNGLTNAQGSHFITITANDSDSETTAITFTLNVSNAPPTLTLDSNLVFGVEGMSVTNGGIFGDVEPADGLIVTASEGTVTTNGNRLEWTHTYSDDGTNQVEIYVTDDNGAGATNTFEVRVTNVVPHVDAGADRTTGEGMSVTNTGTYSDPAGTNDMVVVTTDAGTVTATNGAYVWTHTHGNGPSNSTVRIFVMDEDGGSNSTTFTVTITNIPPALELGANTNLPPGIGMFSRNVPFADPATGETYTGTVDYGAGAGPQPLAVDSMNKTLAVGHTYSESGTFTVAVTINDGDGGMATDSFLVTTALFPEVNAGPDSGTNECGTTATFTVVTGGPGPQTNQWYFSLTNSFATNAVADATNAALTVTASGATAGDYYLAVCNAGGCVTSSVVTLVVVDTTAPAITCPANVTAQCDGDVPPANFAGGSASDICGPIPTVTHVGDSASGSCPKTITRTYRATDASGNTNDCAQTITVHDTTPPVLTCLPIGPFQCIADVPAPSFGGSIQADNCGPGQVTVVHIGDVTNGTCPTIITRTWRGTDTCGNTNDCAQTITVNDTTPPMISCPAAVAVQCFGDIPAADTAAATASDNCGTVTKSHVGDTYATNGAVITVTRTYKATDACTNMATCDQIITVNDTLPPTITCAGNVSVSTSGGTCASNVTFSVTASDNCGTANVTCSPASGSSFALGATTVSCFVEDGHGNTNTCSFTVTVTDTEAPAITCAGNVSVSTSSGTCASNVTFSVTASDNCGTANVTCSPASGSSFALGATTVNCFAEDGHANTNTCSFTVTVSDTEAPTITCAGNVSVSTSGGTCASNVTFSVTASDNCGTANVTCSPASGSSFALGATTVNCFAEDGHGNTNTCSFTVTVSDTELPQFICPGAITNSADAGQCSATFALPPLAASDNCGVASVTSNAPVSFPVGSTTVTWTVVDLHANTNTCTQLIIIRDDTLPTVSCPAPIVTNTTTACSQVVAYLTPGGSDNCTVTNVSCSPASGSAFAVGTNTVTCTATDASGNTGTSTFTVTVLDATPPMMTCPADQSLCTTNPAGRVATFTVPTATDACNGAVAATCVPASGSFLAVGTNAVICSATDAVGNSNGCAFRIIITLDRVPVFAGLAFTTRSNTPVTVAKTKITSRLSDPDADPVTLTGVATTSLNGGTITTTATHLTYTPPTGFTGIDTIEVAFSDGRCGTATGLLVMTVDDGTGLSLNQVGIRAVPGGIELRFAGIPGYPYTIQRALTATGPWSGLTGLTAPSNGLMRFVDTNPPSGMGFYRTVSP